MNTDYFDLLMAIFWIITYLLIIINCIISLKKPIKRISMPLIAGVLNFSWELSAVIAGNGSSWVWIVIGVLDLFIFVYNIFIIKYLFKNGVYPVLYIVILAILTFSFTYLFKYESADWKLITVFAIDLIMAIEYLIVRKKLDSNLIFFIGITRLLGDAFAWLSVFDNMYSLIAGGLVFICNIVYVFILSFSQKSTQQQSN